MTVVFGGRPRTIYPNFKGYVQELMLGGELTRVSAKMKYLGMVMGEACSYILLGYQIHYD